VGPLFVTETKKMNEYVQERRKLAGHHVPTYGAVVDPVSLMEFGSVFIVPDVPERWLIHIEVGDSEIYVLWSRRKLLCCY
jgi:hypothetical protein